MTHSAKEMSAEIPSAAACAEAAAWIARLHREDRTAAVESGFRRWLVASPEHRTAFEMANEIWVGTEQLPQPSTPAFVRWPRPGLVVTLPRALAAAAVIAVLSVAISLYHRDSELATGVGEQRNLSLEDGTRISLNTASRMHVRYDHAARRVVLDEGEAYFEVAKQPDWPFIVVAGRQQVVARGTAFLVRRNQNTLVVTLVEGKVTVAPAGESVTSLSSAPPPGGSSSPVQPQPGSGADITLSPGQRLTVSDHGQPRVDRPALEQATAWQRGQVILDHTPLAAAAAEMNRYSNVELRIDEPGTGRAEVTGIFRSGDSESFARAVAETYHLRVIDHGGKIILSGLPPGPGGNAKDP